MTLTLSAVQRQVTQLRDLPADQRANRASVIAIDIDSLTSVSPETLIRLWIQLGREATGRPIAANRVSELTVETARAAALGAIGAGDPLGEVARAAVAYAEAEAALKASVVAAKRAGVVVADIASAARLKTRQTVYTWTREAEEGTTR